VGRYPDQFTEGLIELARFVVDEESLDESLGRIAELACRTISPCCYASITMDSAGGPLTRASTHEIALGCDEAQYRAQEGPCLSAYQRREVVHIVDTATESRWPVFAIAAKEQGVRASLSIPLVVRDTGIGALNLYSDTVGAYNDDEQHLGTLFGAQCAVAISNAEVYWRTHQLTEHLQAALETRDAIGQAKGILMARNAITSDAAFDLLREASQRSNRKLRDVADDVILTGELPRLDPPTGPGGRVRESTR
jgi:GAF domain-containing protein